MSSQKPTCNLLENNTQVYTPDPVAYIGTGIANAATKSTA
jgi:hypothetical protein